MENKNNKLCELERQRDRYTDLLRHCNLIHADLSFQKQETTDENTLNAIREEIREINIDIKFLKDMRNSFESDIKALKNEVE